MKYIYLALLFIISNSVHGQSNDSVYVKIPYAVYEAYRDGPRQEESILTGVIGSLPSLLDLAGNFFEKEKYEPLLDQKAMGERIKQVRDLVKRYRKDEVPECEYYHLMAFLLDIAPPNCKPWQ